MKKNFLFLLLINIFKNINIISEQLQNNIYTNIKEKKQNLYYTKSIVASLYSKILNT